MIMRVLMHQRWHKKCPKKFARHIFRQTHSGIFRKAFKARPIHRMRVRPDPNRRIARNRHQVKWIDHPAHRRTQIVLRRQRNHIGPFQILRERRRNMPATHIQRMNRARIHRASIMQCRHLTRNFSQIRRTGGKCGLKFSLRRRSKGLLRVESLRLNQCNMLRSSNRTGESRLRRRPAFLPPAPSIHALNWSALQPGRLRILRTLHTVCRHRRIRQLRQNFRRHHQHQHSHCLSRQYSA